MSKPEYILPTIAELKRRNNDFGLLGSAIFGNLAFIGYNVAKARNTIQRTERLLGTAPRYYVISGIVVGYGLGRLLFPQLFPPKIATKAN